MQPEADHSSYPGVCPDCRGKIFFPYCFKCKGKGGKIFKTLLRSLHNRKTTCAFGCARGLDINGDYAIKIKVSCQDLTYGWTSGEGSAGLKSH